MSILVEILLGLGLAMDCFAVSFCRGLVTRSQRRSRGIMLASVFSIFQGAMFAIGATLAVNMRDILKPIDHWVVIVVLGVIGAKMVFESFQCSCQKGDVCTCREEIDLPASAWRHSQIISLGVATSIDALAAGVGFSLLNAFFLRQTLLIAVCSFLLAIVGFFFGSFLSQSLGRWAERLGGAILIVMGLNVFIEHMSRRI